MQYMRYEGKVSGGKRDKDRHGLLRMENINQDLTSLALTLTEEVMNLTKDCGQWNSFLLNHRHRKAGFRNWWWWMQFMVYIIPHHIKTTTHHIASDVHCITYYITRSCIASHRIASHHMTLRYTAEHRIAFHCIADSGHFTMRDAHDDDSDEDSMPHPTKRNRQAMRGSYRMNSANESQVNAMTFTGRKDNGQRKM